MVRADPAGNITLFVLGRKRDAALAKELMGDPRFKAEQVGFVEYDGQGGASMTMAGGEFCGNATRSFALLLARERGLTGKTRMELTVSGAEKPVEVAVDAEAGTAEAAMPLPGSFQCLAVGSACLPAVLFGGITHVIAEGWDASEENFDRIFDAAQKQLDGGAASFDAFGVMFYDAEACFMRPAVYVAALDSLVFESSCGSGSAALVAWLSESSASEGETRLALRQPGGTIEARALRSGGRLVSLSIGGPVELQEVKSF
jgi:diaminopimelate epimerase